jgi:GNAT superfamily N-acetyltransferase
MWVAPLRTEVAKLLDRRRNPFYQHAEAEYFLAERDGAVMGRIAAITNANHWKAHPEESQVGFFGFFECVNDPGVAAALFGAAAGWLGERGMKVMRGPASPSTNDECGLLVDGFDTPPVLLNPHNPPWYAGLVEGAGFTGVMDLLCYVGSGTAPPRRLVDGARRMAERFGITLRGLDMKHFRRDVELIKDLYNRAWEKNWGFVPMTDAEIDVLAAGLKPVVEPDLIVFAEKDGKPIGVGITVPDINVALKRNPSGRLITGLPILLWHLWTRRIHRVRTLILGVLPEYRRTGCDALMFEWTWRKGNARGYYWGEASWLLETNTAIRNGMERMGFRVYKTLRMYDRAL